MELYKFNLTVIMSCESKSEASDYAVATNFTTSSLAVSNTLKLVS